MRSEGHICQGAREVRSSWCQRHERHRRTPCGSVYKRQSEWFFACMFPLSNRPAVHWARCLLCPRDASSTLHAEAHSATWCHTVARDVAQCRHHLSSNPNQGMNCMSGNLPGRMLCEVFPFEEGKKEIPWQWWRKHVHFRPAKQHSLIPALWVAKGASVSATVARCPQYQEPSFDKHEGPFGVIWRQGLSQILSGAAFCSFNCKRDDTSFYMISCGFKQLK